MQWKHTGLTAAALAAAVLCVSGCAGKKVKKTVTREIRVTVQQLEKRTFRRQIPVQGTVMPVEHAVISAKVAGTLVKRDVDEGQTVAKGDRLFIIDNAILKNQRAGREAEVKEKDAAVQTKEAELKAKVAEVQAKEAELKAKKAEFKAKEAELKAAESKLEIARLEVKSAETSRDNARSEYDRTKKLLDLKAASKQGFEKNETDYKTAEFKVQSAQAAVKSAQAAVDNARAAIKSSRAAVENAEAAVKSSQAAVENAQAAVVNAKAQLEQAKSNLKIAEKNLQDSAIRAPFDCTITDKFVEENEYVTVGQNILKLENHKQLEVECFISAVHYDSIKQNKTVAIFGRGGRAVVSYKAPGVDPESRTFKIKILLPGKADIVSGTLCTLQLVLEEKTGYGLPADAVLLRANDRYIAYTVDGKGVARSVEIKRGIVDGKFCEVENAAELTGRRFVVTGQTFVNDGARVKVIEPKK